MSAPTAAELAAKLIRFDTSGAPGEESACLAWVRGLAEEAGLPGVVRCRDARVPNAVFRLSGRGEAPPLVLHGHLDVVAGGDGWGHPPFGGEVHDGVLWGRGAIDMKGAVAMMLAAVLRLRREGFRPAGDVLLALVGDEERGGGLGMRFLVEEHPHLFAGARFALGEFGGVGIEVGGRRLYPVQVAERRLCAIRATVRAGGGHGAFAEAPGAVSRLARLLDALAGLRPAIGFAPPACEILARAAACAPLPLALELRALLAAGRPALADLGIAGGIFAPAIG
ncbi:MAG: M20/M25/M40 family metallo-hydrolase, partial [Solirubrobacterales bacterium]